MADDADDQEAAIRGWLRMIALLIADRCPVGLDFMLAVYEPQDRSVLSYVSNSKRANGVAALRMIADLLENDGVNKPTTH